MRVIAGRARSMPLKTVAGMDTRPTTDRIKETLFNMLNPYLADCRFLDLFAGSGAIGIEALSRGAAQAVFVEQNRRAAACIRENLTFTKLDADARLLVTDVLTGLSELSGEEPFDFIFMDPPYGKGLERQALSCLAHGELVRHDAWIIVETPIGDDLEDTVEYGYSILKIKKYKTNQHVFLTRAGEEEND